MKGWESGGRRYLEFESFQPLRAGQGSMFNVTEQKLVRVVPNVSIVTNQRQLKVPGSKFKGQGLAPVQGSRFNGQGLKQVREDSREHNPGVNTFTF